MVCSDLILTSVKVITVNQEAAFESFPLLPKAIHRKSLAQILSQATTEHPLPYAEAEGRRGAAEARNTAAGVTHPPPQVPLHPGGPLTCPERRVSGLRWPLGVLCSRSCRDGERLPGPAWEAAGSGASGGIWAAAGSRGLTPHPRGAQAEDAARSPREDESGRGAGSLTRASGGRSHGHGTRRVPAPLPRVPGNRWGAASEARTRGSQLRRLRRCQERQKESGARKVWGSVPDGFQPLNSPPPPRGGSGTRAGTGFPERRRQPGTQTVRISPPPTTRGNSAGPAAPLCLDLPAGSAPLLPDLNTAAPRPGCKVVLLEPGWRSHKTHLGNKVSLPGALLRRTASGRKRTHPLASRHRRTRLLEREMPASPVPIRTGGTRAHSVFSGSRSHKTLGSTPLGCFLIRCSLAKRVGVPLAAARVLC
ncbi:hypothetical protein NN561_017813 [Cricetulus griseus]